MSFNWNIEIEAWPHSTGEGQEVDQKACGKRVHCFKHFGSEFEDAFKAAQLIAEGMLTNPRMWQAPIKSIVRKGHD